MDFFSYTSIESLESLTLYELRIIGKSLGIKSPTSKKKGELITEVWTIISEEREKSENVNDNDTTLNKSASTNNGITFNDSGESTIVVNEISVPTEEEFVETEFVLGREEANDEYGLEVDPNEGGFIPETVEIMDGLTDTSNGFSAKEEQEWRKTYKRKEGVNNTKKPIAQQTTENKEEVVTESNKEETEGENVEIVEGVLEIMQDGYGFLRAHNYEGGEKDGYLSAQRIKKFGLRKGDFVRAQAEKNFDNKPGKVFNILSVNGKDASCAFKRKNFDYLTPIYPDSRYRLEIDGAKNDFAIRSIDLVAPIGKGQRAMIVSPPKAGKTTLLKNVAKSISANYPDAHLIVLLIDERPEEVTDMQRSINGEVVYSTFDEMPEHHTKAAELVLERAKRLVEMGEDVVILMDSLTRLARAYNLTISPTGRTLSGGIDPGALHSPKRFFGAARNIENGGSLTIIATALVDTGSRMDDVIYEEFKGTGNMEIHLDRRLTEKRIFPAIDLNRSGTRREELLLSQKELETVWNMRRMLNAGDGGDASEQMISELIKTKTNKEFMEQMDMKIKMMRQQGFWRN